MLLGIITCAAWGHLNFIYYLIQIIGVIMNPILHRIQRNLYENKNETIICFYIKKVFTKGNLSDHEESSRPTALSRLCITCWMIFKIFHCSHQEPIFLLSFVSISRIPHGIYLLAGIAKWLTVLKFSWEDSPEMK